MNIKKTANRIRYNYYFSFFARSMLCPIQKVCGWLDRQVQTKVWVNGATVSYDGLTLRFPRNIGVNYCSAIWWKGVDGYEPNTWKVIRYFLQKSKHFLDIGSNIGLYAVLAKKVNPDIVVDAFEPIPSIYRKNVQLHQINGIDTSRIHNIALGSEGKEMEMYVPVDNSALEETSAATLRKNSWQSRKLDSRRIKVRVERLDTFLKSHDAHLPMVMKIDVEDYESEVLRGAQETITTLKPVVICEILPRAHGNVETYDFLEHYGYSVFGICRNGLFRMLRADLGRSRDFTDFLLLPKSTLSPSQNYISYSNMSEIVLPVDASI